MIEFLVCGEERGEQNHHHGLSEDRIWPVQDAGCEGPLGESPEGQSGPGRLDILQGRSLKGTGAGCPHVLQDELVGKMTSLAEQGALAETQVKKEGLSPTEERAGNSRGVQESR